MKKIKIKRNTLVDTRTATRVPTFCEFDDGNRGHCDDVRNMMFELAAELKNRGSHHDYTKLYEPHRSLFYRELCAKIEGKMDSFVCGVWYPMHCATERHHLDEYCPENVNLIDVLEMIADCVCAGLARTGELRPIEIPSEILQKAVENTAKMCFGAVESVD